MHVSYLLICFFMVDRERPIPGSGISFLILLLLWHWLRGICSLTFESPFLDETIMACRNVIGTRVSYSGVITFLHRFACIFVPHFSLPTVSFCNATQISHVIEMSPRLCLASSMVEVPPDALGHRGRLMLAVASILVQSDIRAWDVLWTKRIFSKSWPDLGFYARLPPGKDWMRVIYH